MSTHPGTGRCVRSIHLNAGSTLFLHPFPLLSRAQIWWKETSVGENNWKFYLVSSPSLCGLGVSSHWWRLDIRMMEIATPARRERGRGPRLVTLSSPHSPVMLSWLAGSSRALRSAWSPPLIYFWWPGPPAGLPVPLPVTPLPSLCQDWRRCWTGLRLCSLLTSLTINRHVELEPEHPPSPWPLSRLFWSSPAVASPVCVSLSLISRSSHSQLMSRDQTDPEWPRVTPVLAAQTETSNHHVTGMCRWLRTFPEPVRWRNTSIHFVSCWSDFQKVLKHRKVMLLPLSRAWPWRCWWGWNLWLGRNKQILPCHQPSPSWSNTVMIPHSKSQS